MKKSDNDLPEAGEASKLYLDLPDRKPGEEPEEIKPIPTVPGNPLGGFSQIFKEYIKKSIEKVERKDKKVKAKRRKTP